MLPVGPCITISVMVSLTSLLGSDTGCCLDADAQHQPAHPQLVAVSEQAALGALAVDQRAIGAAQVLHERALAFQTEEGVRARDGGLVEHEVRAAPAPDHGAGAIERPAQPLVEATRDA